MIEKTAGLIDRLAKRLEDALQSNGVDAPVDAEIGDQAAVHGHAGEVRLTVAA